MIELFLPGCELSTNPYKEIIPRLWGLNLGVFEVERGYCDRVIYCMERLGWAVTDVAYPVQFSSRDHPIWWFDDVVDDKNLGDSRRFSVPSTLERGSVRIDCWYADRWVAKLFIQHLPIGTFSPDEALGFRPITAMKAFGCYVSI